jgi:hypothetical protein
VRHGWTGNAGCWDPTSTDSIVWQTGTSYVATGTYSPITPGSQLGVACELRQTVTRAQTFTTWSAVHKAGVNTTRRRWGAYCFAGNCDWGGDGTRGLISTCLDAHPKASYAFRLPRWSAIRGYGKVVSGSVK